MSLPTADAALDDEVHVWCVRLDAAPDVVARTYVLLNQGERERADRYRFAHLRTSFILSRGVLHVLLAAYIGARPELVQLVSGVQGKPSLAGPDARLRFNVSHSGKLMVAAFTFDAEVGIDVEQLRPVRDAALLAKRYFHRAEVEDLEHLAANEREIGWFRCWVQKEAYIKAVGAGMSIPLDSFRVPIAASVDDRPQRIEGPSPEVSRWTLRAVETPSGYVAALVVADETKKRVVRREHSAQDLL